MPASNFASAIGQGLLFKQQQEQAKLQRQQQLMELDEQRKGAIFQDARSVNTFLKANQPERALGVLSDRMSFIEQFGGDPRDTKEVKDLIVSGDIQGAVNLLDTVEQAGIQSGYLKEPKKAGEGKITANIADYLFLEELKKQGKKDEADAFANKSGLSKLDPQQAAALQVETERLKAQDKEKAKRLSGFVNDGVGAADSVGNIRRSLALLDSVKTGGFDNVALRAKQIFGVEGADEGELSNSLGKAVLSQLRSTFGAAFTAKEGEQLQRIEAGFSKSSATNKRLLRNALKVAERASKRGIRAAESLGDDFSAKEIRLALDNALGDINLDIGNSAVQPQAQPTQAQSNFTSPGGISYTVE